MNILTRNKALIPYLSSFGDVKAGVLERIGSRANESKRFLESNASSIPGTLFRLG